MGNTCTQKLNIEQVTHQDKFDLFNSPKILPFFQSQKPYSSSSSDDLSLFKESLTKNTFQGNHLMPYTSESKTILKQLTKRSETNSDVIDYKKKPSKVANKSIMNVTLSISNEIENQQVSLTDESFDKNLKETKSASNLPSLKNEKPVFGEYQKGKTLVTQCKKEKLNFIFNK